MPNSAGIALSGSAGALQRRAVITIPEFFLKCKQSARIFKIFKRGARISETGSQDPKQAPGFLKQASGILKQAFKIQNKRANPQTERRDPPKRGDLQNMQKPSGIAIKRPRRPGGGAAYLSSCALLDFRLTS
ncbi:MAG: hypothetical protein HDT26_12675 [Subdoligranulum sp.]|nr:hypothetical protein [Subdoligranulum sp.]